MNTNAAVEEIEIARSDLDPVYLRERIADWKRRVSEVFVLVRRWADRQGASVEELPAEAVQEEVMRRHGVPPYTISSLVVRKGGHVIKVIPRGLWTIGGNGRIDLVTTTGLYALVDYAEPFAQPDWKIYGPGRREGLVLSEDALFGLI